MSVAELRAWYRSVFHNHVVRGGEDSLRDAYELGREAVARGLSLLDLAEIHNEALLYEMRLGIVDPEDVALLGGEVFLESVSAFEMVRRGYQESREVASLQRSHLEMLRRLSSFLADTSLVSDSRASLEEVLRLIAEQACELIGARLCVVSVRAYGERLQASSLSPAVGDGHVNDHPVAEASPPSGPRSTALLTALDGKELGSIEVFGKEGSAAVDQAALDHIAQMVSAVIERLRMHAIERNGS